MGNTPSSLKYSFYITKVLNTDLPLVPFIHLIVGYNNMPIGDTSPLTLKEILKTQDLNLEVHDLLLNKKFRIIVPKFGIETEAKNQRLGINIIKIREIPNLLKMQILAIKESTATDLKVGDSVIGVEGEYCESEDELLSMIREDITAPDGENKTDTRLISLVVVRDGKVTTVQVKNGELGCEVGMGLIYSLAKRELFMDGYTGKVKKSDSLEASFGDKIVSTDRDSLTTEAIRSDESVFYNSSSGTQDRVVNPENKRDVVEALSECKVSCVTSKSIDDSKDTVNGEVKDTVDSEPKDITISEIKSNVNSENKQPLVDEGKETRLSETNASNQNLGDLPAEVASGYANSPYKADQNAINSSCESPISSNEREEHVDLPGQPIASFPADKVRLPEKISAFKKMPEHNEKRTASYVYRSPRSFHQGGHTTDGSTSIVPENSSINEDINMANPIPDNNITDPVANSNSLENDTPNIQDNSFTNQETNSLDKPINNVKIIYNEANIPEENQFFEGQNRAPVETVHPEGSGLVAKEDFTEEGRLKDEIFEERKADNQPPKKDIQKLFEDDDGQLPFEHDTSL